MAACAQAGTWAGRSGGHIVELAAKPQALAHPQPVGMDEVHAVPHPALMPNMADAHVLCSHLQWQAVQSTNLAVCMCTSVAVNTQHTHSKCTSCAACTVCWPAVWCYPV